MFGSLPSEAPERPPKIYILGWENLELDFLEYDEFSSYSCQ